MCVRNRYLVVAALAVLWSAVSVSAGPVSMSYIQNSGESRVFRGQIGGLTTVNSVTVTDAGFNSGTNGIFSGFDLDFIFFDVDGDWSTTGDRILPLQTSATSVTPGTVIPQSPYIPTVAHPGQLFGLEAGGAIDFATATLGLNDAYTDPLNYDNNTGWVSLGYGGSLSAAFPTTDVGSGLYVFIGDSRTKSQEQACVSVGFQDPTVPVPGAILLAAMGTCGVTWLRRRRQL